MKIFICGFSGAGKSTWVKLLGSNLGSAQNYQIVDTDEEICKLLAISFDQLGMKIEEIGEAEFRKIEMSLVLSLLQQTNSMLVALGGGALNDEILNKIKNSTDGRLIYLKVDFETCYKRINADHNRMLSKFSKDEIYERFYKREKFYLKADYIVDQDQIKSIDGLSSLVHTLK